MPSALARRSPENVVTMIVSVAGDRHAPATPCTARAVVSQAASVASPPARLASAQREASIAQLPMPGGLSFQSGTGYLLAKVGAVATQRWTATLAQTGVSRNQFLVLMALAETGPVCQQFLAGVIGIDPRNIVPILDSLEERGLVSRETDRADRRRRMIDLTSAGWRIVAELSALGEQTEHELLAPVPQADRESLRRILRSVLDAAMRSH
jgi:DNA-binding MarR family transcriptional regulator